MLIKKSRNNHKIKPPTAPDILNFWTRSASVVFARLNTPSRLVTSLALFRNGKFLQISKMLTLFCFFAAVFV